MRSKAKLLFLLIISAIMLQTVGFAKEKNDVPRKYRIQAYTKAVEKELGHKTETYEQSIIEAAYAYYGIFLHTLYVCIIIHIVKSVDLSKLQNGNWSLCPGKSC